MNHRDHHWPGEEFFRDIKAAQEYQLKRLGEILTKGSQPVRGSLPMPIGINTNSKLRISTVGARVVGFAVRETTGAASATFSLYDGANSTDGDLIIPVTLTAGESAREWWAPSGVTFVNGIVQAWTGSVTGVIFLGAVDV